MKEKTETRLALAAVITIAGGLGLDAWAGTAGQAIVDLWAWILLGTLLRYSPATERPALLACLGFATLGEMVLSLVWGLYDYRLRNLPLFVPPGHVLLFWLGLFCAKRLPNGLLRQIPWLACLGVLGLAATGHDLLSLPLLLIYLLCWRFGPSPRLYSTMFMLALIMELWGTALGNWAWRPHVPMLNWATQNPPLAAGAFYCGLDLLVLLATGRPRQALDPAEERP